MEYGEAINTESSERALTFARELNATYPDVPLEEIGRQAVDRAYCACVTNGEDAAERRFSDVHRRLIEQVVARLQPNLRQRRVSPTRSHTPASLGSTAIADPERSDP